MSSTENSSCLVLLMAANVPYAKNVRRCFSSALCLLGLGLSNATALCFCTAATSVSSSSVCLWVLDSLLDIVDLSSNVATSFIVVPFVVGQFLCCCSLLALECQSFEESLEDSRVVVGKVFHLPLSMIVPQSSCRWVATGMRRLECGLRRWCCLGPLLLLLIRLIPGRLLSLGPGLRLASWQM